jgi:DNA polymerase III subunit gamma/tau
MSYQVIARKYRPQAFDEVVGQGLITETLKNAVTNGRVAHGYIFSGARGVGKTTSARILAKSLNCVKGPTVQPCGECPSCLEITAGNSTDVFEIDAASNRGIDEIRQLRETARYLPARDPYRVFIIDEAHMLTTEAFNALLKTLEEPPPRSLFILATTEPHKLPPTIQSRCQHFSFRLLDYTEIIARLKWICEQEKVESDEEALSALARAAEGSLRDALSLLDQVIAASGNRLEGGRVRQILGVVPAELFLELVGAIADADAPRVLEMVGRLVNEGYELAHFSGQLTGHIRDMAVAKACGAESPLLQAPAAERAALATLAKRFSEGDLTRFFQILLRAEADMRYSLQPRYDLELALLKLVHAKKLAPLETLLAELRRGGVSEPASRPVKSSSASAGSAPARMESSPPPAMPSIPGPRAAAAHEASPASIISRNAPQAAAPATSPVRAEDPRLHEIKSLAFEQSKLLSSCLDPISGWRFENGEVQFLYSKKNFWAADLLNSRERQEMLRSVCAQVLGQPVKICVKLDEQDEEPRGSRVNLRERAAGDESVKAFQKAFNGALVEVIDLSQE